MKLTVAGVAAFIASGVKAAVEALPSCLYCRYTDLKSTFLESYSFCDSAPECLADEWNYIDRPCESGWKRAKQKSLDDCNTQMVTCPEFVASMQYDLSEPLGTAKNLTWILPSGAKCVVKIDATNYVGRVLFADVQGYLGIEGRDPAIPLAEKISFEKEIGEVMIYNAAETGSLRFTISFSGATTLATAATGILVTTLAFF